ncbi:hypothetical protein [Nonlabens ponticola]|uniref:Uncharacterized protein n=1 Tax=Nonlabens ponticola TaxID=2496866 RepID=A0A3S9N0K6_9FLAO|nr:hypothetical protein [Nonlabens ponticola]AZQ44947.1 hypothetical protein EJ995_12195 [Nonlabens ponticola]
MNKLKSIVLFLLMCLCSCNGESIKELSDAHYEEIRDIQLTAVVTDIDDPWQPFHGFGLISLEIIDSNTEMYDPRPHFDEYLFILKKDQMELYQSLSLLSIGDTVKVDMPNKKIRYFLNEYNRVEEFTPQLYDEPFYHYFIERDLQKL